MDDFAFAFAFATHLTYISVLKSKPNDGTVTWHTISR
jgi:hypothetical protein